MQITSTAFENEGTIPQRYTCQEDDMSPPLTVHNAPGGARSLALIVDDPDAATDPNGPGIIWDHWVLFNIDPSTTEFSEGSVPEGAIQGVNGAGNIGYMGPCPPTGTHRYFFKLYALENKLSLPEGATKQETLDALEGLVLGKAELIGTYAKID